MKEYRKYKQIERLSCLVGYLNKFSSSNIEIILISIHLIAIILCIMNIFIIPWNILKKALFCLRITILTFLIVSIVCVFFNFITRKIKKLYFGDFFIAFFSSLFAIGLILLDFLFILITLIIIYTKVKNYTEKKYDHKSILAIDIISLLIIIPILFLWYSDILNVYAKINSNECLKEYLDAQMKFYTSQNAKIINVDQGVKSNENVNTNEANTGKKNNNEEEDIISSNNFEINTNKPHENRKINSNSINKRNEMSNDSMKNS